MDFSHFLHTLNNDCDLDFFFFFGLQSKIYSKNLTFIFTADSVFLELVFSTLM